MENNEPYNIVHLENRELWLGSRRIGGSDASCIIGKNPYRTNIDLYHSIVDSNAPQKNISNMRLVEYGTKAEAPIRELFSLDHPEYTVISPCKKGIDLLVSKHYDFITATLDGQLIEKATGRKGFLEVKTSEVVSSMHKEKWNDKVPENYYCQVLHYFYVTGAEFAVLCVELKFKNAKGEQYSMRRCYEWQRKDVFEDMKFLISEEIGFWNKYVLNKQEPPLLLGII